MKAPRSDRLAGGTIATRGAAALLALLLAAPLLATVWTRASCRVRIPKGGTVTLEDLSYAGRDWNAALTGLEVRQVADRNSGAGMVSTSWTFRYTNTDREPHYVAVSVGCLDAGGRERFRFKATVTLVAGHPGGGTVEVNAKMRESDWSATSVAKIVADFLSSPEG